MNDHESYTWKRSTERNVILCMNIKRNKYLLVRLKLLWTHKLLAKTYKLWQNNQLPHPLNYPADGKKNIQQKLKKNINITWLTKSGINIGLQ